MTATEIANTSGVRTVGAGEQFFRGGGRLRLSLTKRCNLSCKFCHREGGLDRKHMYVGVETFARVANECFALGGVEVNLTGGEPTLFDDLAELIDRISRPADRMLSITTNGCSIEKLLLVRNKATLSKVNVSLHGTDEDFLFSMISRNYDLPSVLDNIAQLAQHYRVCLNFSLMRENESQLIDVFCRAHELGVDLKVINFQEIRWNAKKLPDQFVSPRAVYPALAAYSESKGWSISRNGPEGRFGALLEKFTVGSTQVTVVDGDQWHQSMQACATCKYATICKEGFYAIRLYSDGTLAPCLHREDLARDFIPSLSLAENVDLLLRGIQ